ncbi:MAG: cysteine-rich CWC family protein [Candidatus Hydrogenedentes bacterium]|nr:cysteine-rich CWC family protein [Candidatus Hydrogenedentota bacterium]
MKQEQNTCPRCGAMFRCAAGAIETCQCHAVDLTAEQTQFIRAKHVDCLCARCLTELKTVWAV